MCQHFPVVGCYASLFPVILVDLLGLTILEKSMGQVLAVSSVAFLFASPMSGTEPLDLNILTEVFNIHSQFITLF